MIVGAALSAAGALALGTATSTWQALAFGGLMAAGSGAFSSASWAMMADLVPREEAARYFGLANFGTAGAAACAGLLGPLVDWGNGVAPGGGYVALFAASSLAFAASAAAVRGVAGQGRRQASQ
jgi:MFS family permease